MILFGRKDKHLVTEKLPAEVCPNCKKPGGVLSMFIIYFHIALLPIIPISRKIASQCLSCRDVKILKDFSETQTALATAMRKKYKTPYWTMIGGAILLILLIVKLILKWT